MTVVSIKGKDCPASMEDVRQWEFESSRGGCPICGKSSILHPPTPRMTG